MEEQQTYTVDQVAKRLQVSAKTVRNWIRDRKLRAKKSGRASIQDYRKLLTRIPRGLHDGIACW
jgi:excisionase family DNA binding protein